MPLLLKLLKLASSLPSFQSPCKFVRSRPKPIARKKAEREALLAAEEASLQSKGKAAPKAGAKKKPADKLVATGTGVAGYSVSDPLNLRKAKGPDGEPEEVKELSAKGIDEMLEALELVNQKTDKATVGSKVKPVLHPGEWFYERDETDGKEFRLRLWLILIQKCVCFLSVWHID